VPFQFAVPARRDLAAVVTKANPEPVKPAAPKGAPPPEPASTDDDDEGEDEGGPGYVIAAALAGLALVVWGVFRVSRRARVNPNGERDASGDRP
jgi:hypothetical protein